MRSGTIGVDMQSLTVWLLASFWPSSATPLNGPLQRRVVGAGDSPRTRRSPGRCRWCGTWPIASKFSNARPIGSISVWQPAQLEPADSCAAKRMRAVAPWSIVGSEMFTSFGGGGGGVAEHHRAHELPAQKPARSDRGDLAPHEAGLA